RDDRPAPSAYERGLRAQFAAFVASSLAAHLALGMMLNSDAAPIPSVGEEAITVEIIVGANTAAGLAEAPVKSDAGNPATAEGAENGAPKHQRTEQVAPQDPVPELPTAVAHQERKSDDIDTPTTKPDDTPVPVTKPQTPSVPSSGIGRGRSAADANYYG